MKVQRDRALSSKTKKKLKTNEQPTQCGDTAHAKVTIVARDAAKSAAAFAALKAAIAEFDKHPQGKTGGDEAAARYFYGQAKLVLADKDFESYIALGFPVGLNFDPNNKAMKEKSLKRFDDWVKQKQKIGGDAVTKYQAVLDVKDAADSIAAAARRGQIPQDLNDALFTAAIPQDVRTGEFAEDKVEAFCDKMAEVADPLEKASIDAYGACLDESTKLGWFSEWSKLCERELGQIKPDEFPSVSELRAEPNEVAPIVDVEPPAAKIE
jgi:hypothetical protein